MRRRSLFYMLVLGLLVIGMTGPNVPYPDQEEDGQVTVDWERGTWTFRDRPAGKSVARLTFAGDWKPGEEYSSLMRQNPTAVYGEMLPVLRESDLSFVNVETAIGTAGSPVPKGGPNFQASPEMVEALTAVPFDVGLLANNHSVDYGPASLEETKQLLEQAGIETVGAGMSHEEAAAPLFLKAKGVTVAVINCAEGEEGRSVDGGPGVYGLDVPTQKAQIQALRPHVDVIVVTFHGGREYMPLPPPYVARALRSFAEAGADAVVAHHPHVPQGIEVVDGVPIVYSQGNFIFWQSGGYYRRLGYLVSLDVDEQGLASMKITPYQQTEKGLTHLSDARRSDFMDELKTLSGYLEDGREGAVWNAYIDYVGTGTAQLKQLAAGIDEGNTHSAELMRNIFFTRAHRQLFIDRMDRVVSGQMGTSPEWAKEIVRRWLERPVADLYEDPSEHEAEN